MAGKRPKFPALLDMQRSYSLGERRLTRATRCLNAAWSRVEHTRLYRFHLQLVRISWRALLRRVQDILILEYVRGPEDRSFSGWRIGPRHRSIRFGEI